MILRRGLFRALLVLLISPGATVSQAQSSLPVAPFSAEYTVYGRGLALGKGSIRLSDEGGGRYRMQSRVEPEGLAAMLISDRINEDVDGVFDGSVPLPQTYLQRHASKTKERITRYRFDWRNAQVAASYQNGDEQQNAMLRLSTGTVDPLSLHLLVMTNLQRGVQPDHYAMLSKTELKRYAARYHGEETLATPLGELRVLRVSQSREGSSRETVFWFAVDFNYLPAQIAQYKKGKEQLRMLIEAVRMGS